MTAHLTEERTFYHVAGIGYGEGEDLYSWDELEAMGETPKWKWEGEPFDTDVICLFETLDEAREMQRDFGGTLLRVVLPAETHILRVTEGFPAVYRRICSDCITPIND